MKKAIANERPRPSQAECHSQTLRLIAFVREDAFSVAGPNPMKIQMMNVTIAGMIRPIRTSKPVETFSLVRGKDMLGSVISNGRLLGLTFEIAAPTAAIAL